MKKLSQKIIEYLSDSFEKELFNAILDNFNDSMPNPLRFNNFAYTIRELMTIILDKYAPADDVKACNWYREQADEVRDGVTRVQKLRYMTTGEMDDDEIQNIISVDLKHKIDDVIKQYKKQFDKLSKFTHIRENSFNMDQKTSKEQAEEVLKIICNILGLIHFSTDTYSAIKTISNIELDVFTSFVSNMIDELDILSTHTQVDDVWVDNIKINNIKEDSIYLNGEGAIDCILQYGSDGDQKRGDGVIANDNYPFTFNAILRKRHNSGSYKVKIYDLNVDTSTFYE